MGNDITNHLKKQVQNLSRHSEDVVYERCCSTEMFIYLKFNRGNWMSNLSHFTSNKKLTELKLMGSHDSGTYSIVMLGDDFSVTQNCSIYYQLLGGVRYIDLRAGTYKNVDGVRLGHGIHYGDHFRRILENISTFVNKHPKEVIIIHIGNSGGELSSNQKFEVLEDMEILFGNVMVKKSDNWYNIRKSTMKEFWENKKSVIVYVDDFIIYSSKLNSLGKYEDLSWEEANQRGFWQANYDIFNPWANTNSMTTLRERNIEYFYKAQNLNNLYVCQYVIVPKIYGLYYTTKQMQHDNDLPNFYRQFSNKGRFNIILADFVFGCNTGSESYFVDEVIRSNMNLDYKIGKIFTKTGSLNVRIDRNYLTLHDQDFPTQKFIFIEIIKNQYKILSYDEFKSFKFNENDESLYVSDIDYDGQLLWTIDSISEFTQIINQERRKALEFDDISNIIKISDSNGEDNQFFRIEFII